MFSAVAFGARGEPCTDRLGAAAAGGKLVVGCVLRLIKKQNKIATKEPSADDDRRDKTYDEFKPWAGPANASLPAASRPARASQPRLPI